MTAKINSMTAQRALKTLGENLKMARLKRRIAVKDFAERVGVSESTIGRLERGDSGVSIGTLAMACLVLGEIERVSGFLDLGSDEAGLLLDKATLPKRIHRSVKQNTGTTQPSHQADDEQGIGF